jgi:hypothetical protein
MDSSYEEQVSQGTEVGLSGLSGLLRRLFPAFCGALLLSLPLACGAPEEPASTTGVPGSEKPSAKKSAPVQKEDRGIGMPSGPRTRRQVRVVVEDKALDPSRGELLIYGFAKDQLDEVGLPKESGLPKFVWRDLRKRESWPIEVELELLDDPEVRLLAVSDIDGSGRLSLGDLVGVPISLGDALEGSVVQLSIVRELPGPNQEVQVPFPSAEDQVPFPTTEPKSSGCNYLG